MSKIFLTYEQFSVYRTLCSKHACMNDFCVQYKNDKNVFYFMQRGKCQLIPFNLENFNEFRKRLLKFNYEPRFWFYTKYFLENSARFLTT